MLASIISLILLFIAVFILIKTKPNLFLFDLMREVFGETKINHAAHNNEESQKENPYLHPLHKD
jgi:hypothetical protein